MDNSNLDMSLIKHIRRFILIAITAIAITDPYILFADCPQNNFTVTGFQLRDQNGNPFSVTDDYKLGDQVSGELWVMLGGSSTNGYNMRFFFDIYINGTKTQEDQYNCLFPGQQAQQNVWWPVRDFSWKWGDVVDIKDIFIHWDTGSAQTGTSCIVSDKNNINSQCYGNLNGYTAAVPLFPKFNFLSNGICNTTIQFSSQTIGGTPPFNYTFAWDFAGLGTAIGTNPLFNFPSSGTYTIGLTANDGTTITTIYKDIFIDPNFGIQVDIFPTKINEDSGIIYVQSVTGGTPPYTFSWVGPNGFTSSSRDIFNLSDGLYTLTVTDTNGCTQTVSYELDIASVLSFTWESIELFNDFDQTTLRWTVPSETEDCYYEIERSHRDANNFMPVGLVLGEVGQGTSTVYEYSDSSFPRYEDSFYYRIVRRSGEQSSISPVKMIQSKGNSERKNSWVLYPNPSHGDNVYLKYLGEHTSGPLQIDIYNTGTFLGSFRIPHFSSERIDLKTLLPNLPKGLILIRIQSETGIETIQLINRN